MMHKKYFGYMTAFAAAQFLMSSNDNVLTSAPDKDANRLTPVGEAQINRDAPRYFSA